MTNEEAKTTISAIATFTLGKEKWNEVHAWVREHVPNFQDGALITDLLIERILVLEREVSRQAANLTLFEGGIGTRLNMDFLMEEVRAQERAKHNQVRARLQQEIVRLNQIVEEMQ